MYKLAKPDQNSRSKLLQVSLKQTGFSQHTLFNQRWGGSFTKSRHNHHPHHYNHHVPFPLAVPFSWLLFTINKCRLAFIIVVAGDGLQTQKGSNACRSHIDDCVCVTNFLEVSENTQTRLVQLSVKQNTEIITAGAAIIQNSKCFVKTKETKGSMVTPYKCFCLPSQRTVKKQKTISVVFECTKKK